jgi:hypothetical protein
LLLLAPTPPTDDTMATSTDDAAADAAADAAVADDAAADAAAADDNPTLATDTPIQEAHIQTLPFAHP